jgi:Na+-driven multidrug efflux pump
VRFRRLADGTFAIYLMHYPLMMLARALNLLRPDAPVLDTVTVTSIVLLLIALSGPLDGIKSVLRHVLRNAGAARRTLTTQAVPELR